MATAIIVLAVAACAGSSPTSSAVTPIDSCATADGAYLDRAHPPLSGSFDSLAEQRFTAPPLEGHNAGGGRSPGPAISDWRAARLRGWIARIAVTGPDRASEDRYAESLGYQVGSFPLVPLVGPVVEHNPGILEVYQTNTEYQSATGARDYMKDLASSALQAETTTVTQNGIPLPHAIPIKLTGGDENTAYETPQYLIPKVGAAERFFTFSVRFGRYVLQVSVQGGDGLVLTAGLGVLNIAAISLTHSCGMAPAALRAVDRVESGAMERSTLRNHDHKIRARARDYAKLGQVTWRAEVGLDDGCEPHARTVAGVGGSIDRDRNSASR